MKIPSIADPLTYFTFLAAQGQQVLLFEAALAIGQDALPAIDFAATQADLDHLLAGIRKRLPEGASPLRKLRALTAYFYQELGFSANLNNYYDPDNSYLHRVLETRRGIPISLAVLFMEFAQQLNFSVHGISFPGHFLLKLPQADGDVILDPLTGQNLSRDQLEFILRPHLLQMAQQNPDNGKVAQHEEFWEIEDFQLRYFLQSADPAQILMRMLQNLKMIFAHSQEWEKLLPVLQRMLILHPDDAYNRRDRGFAFAKLDCPQAAVHDFEFYLSERPQAHDAENIRSLLGQLKQAAGRLN